MGDIERVGTGHPVDVLARAALEALGLDPTGGQS
jgi:hypothetical protein